MKKNLFTFILLAIVVIVSNSVNAAITDGLTSYWGMDNSSVFQTDSVSSTRHMVLVSGPTFGVTGKINNAVRFDQTNSYGGNTSSAFDSQYMSFALWMKTNLQEGNKGIISKWQTIAGTGEYSWAFTTEDSGVPPHLDFLVRDTAGTSSVIQRSFNYSDNIWHHYAGTFNGTHMALYIDGVLINTTAKTGTLRNSSGIVLRVANYGAQYKNATIDEVAIWDRGITPSEVSQLYNSGNGLAYPFTVEAAINTINITLNNSVNGTYIGFTSISNLTGNITFNYFNITGNGFCVTATGNGTRTNCTTSGSGSNTYFNFSVNQNISGTVTVAGQTYQSLINVSAYKIFLNTIFTSYNITNNFNFTTSGLIQANNGSNNIKVSIPNYYEKNVTCNGISLSTVNCNITGIYDDVFTIGANFFGSGISNFTITATNSTLGGVLYNVSTITGNVTLPLLTGYNYYFTINASLYSLNNATLPANASTNLYNFSLLQQNTFDLRFFNESTNTQLVNTTVYVEFISDLFSQNYSTTNGTLLVPLLIPSSYRIKYYYDAAVPRDYYVVLNPQSYQNITLYTIDASISNLYLPVVVDQSLYPVGNASISMLRYYVGCNCYKVVEMTVTDNNGQGVLRVVPNVIPYKLIISKGGFSFTTDPTKFTSSTNAYTLNLESNPLTSIINIPSVSRSITFNNSTKTYTFTWSDTKNLVIEGCLKIEKFHLGTYTIPSNQCSSGSSGSIIYTVTDTNETTYSATGIIKTNTEYSTYYVGPLDISYTTAFSFGIVGLLVGLIIMLAIIFLGNEMGTDMMVLLSIMALVGMAAFGFIVQSWSVSIPMVILAFIIIYKTRT